MTRTTRPLAMLLALTVGFVPLLGCQGGARRRPTGAQGGADGSAQGGGAESGGGTEVNLSAADLAPIDAYVRRPQWILGDEVDIIASKEYFVGVLSYYSATRTGMVKREDFEEKDQAVSVITFLGRPQDVSEQTAPRVLIGTGLTITARRKITVRFVPTRSADLPVRLRIAANGKASIGSKANILRREPSIVIGVQLRRMPGGGYQYEEQ